MQTLSKRDVDSFRLQGYHIARGVFGPDEIARLRTGFAHIQGLAARTNLCEEVLKGHGELVGPEHPDCVVVKRRGVAVREAALVAGAPATHAGPERVDP